MDRNCDNDDKYDPETDFMKFLEEAKQYVRDEANLQSSLLNSKEDGNRRSGEDNSQRRRSSSKSWKDSIFKWWKPEKKKSMESQNNSPTSTDSSFPKRKNGRNFSGQLHIRSYSGMGDTGLRRRPISGPLFMNHFKPKQVENEMMHTSYICLDRLNNSHDVSIYGPLYLVS